eukprot:TRINITY_DN81552_c0_g1_i1.p1 TRINITY_DN81552_c0_g1~~TRINITY_DN81552_c0_g1_i1.p1  ORF type:complete len:641 (+),score=81.73 TRINITY_DN81552_c0_g1_i1:42-1964(+)
MAAACRSGFFAEGRAASCCLLQRSAPVAQTGLLEVGGSSGSSCGSSTLPEGRQHRRPGRERERAEVEACRCPVREVSWEIFTKIRRKASQQRTFAGCEHFVAASLYEWHPAELVDLAWGFSSSSQRIGSSSTFELLRRLLWRADRLVQHLRPRKLVRLLEVYAACGIREHDARRADLFRTAAPRLTDAASSLSAPDINKIAAVYRQLNLRDAMLFEALACRLVELLLQSVPDKLGKPEDDAINGKAIALPATSQSQLALVDDGASLSLAAGFVPRGPAVTAGFSFLTSCGRLNIAPSCLRELVALVGPFYRSKRDFERLAALAQLSAKFGLASQGEVEAVYVAMRDSLLAASSTGGQGQPATPSVPASRRGRRAFSWQVTFGQLLLALVFDEAACASRDAALVDVVSAVHRAFGNALDALDERLSRQLQVAELACRLERPLAYKQLGAAGLLPFLEEVNGLAVPHGEGPIDAAPLTKVSSQQHLQVSAVLDDLGVQHRLEERLWPYVADIRVRGGRRLIEIDGPLHFVGQSSVYDLKSALKHRLLTKQGWEVHHIAWFDWPAQRHNRATYMTRLLRSRPAGETLREYKPFAGCELGSGPQSLLPGPLDNKDLDVASWLDPGQAILFDIKEKPAAVEASAG